MAGGIFWTETFRAASYLQYETLNAHDSEFKTRVSSPHHQGSYMTQCVGFLKST